MAKTKKPGMKWFYFLIYFVLWINAIIFALNGIVLLIGGTYSEYMYNTYPMLQKMEMAFGITYLVFALFCVIARSRLAKFKKRAPGWLNTFYILSVLIAICNVLSTCVVMQLSLQGTLQVLLNDDVIVPMLGTFLIILINHAYFKKRKHLFVN